MPDATLDRPGFSQQTLPVRNNTGEPLVSRTFTKAELDFEPTGDALEPRQTSDQWSGSELVEFGSFFKGQNAYSDANAFADFIKSPSGGNAISLDVPLPEFPSSAFDVVPVPSADACTLTYRSTDWVDIDVSFARVDSVAAVDTSTQASTPSSGGSGPIELRDSSEVVEFTDGIEVTRSVGRPAGALDPEHATYPSFRGKEKSASDRFTLSIVFEENPISKADTLMSLVRTRRHRDSLTLDFNGRYGMGQFNVQPDGGVEQSRAADGSPVQLFSVDLRRVL